MVFFFFKQKTAYEMRISDWSSDVCSSDLAEIFAGMAEEGTVVLNRDDLMFPQVAAKAKAKKLKIITFGSHQDADCRLIKCMVDQGWLWEIGRASCRGRVCQYV